MWVAAGGAGPDLLAVWGLAARLGGWPGERHRHPLGVPRRRRRHPRRPRRASPSACCAGAGAGPRTSRRPRRTRRPTAGRRSTSTSPLEGAIGTIEAPEDLDLEPEVEPAPPSTTTPTIERPDAPAGRLRRLRARLARSNTALGKGLLALLSGGKLDEAAWEEVEDTLLAADLGVGATTQLVDALRIRVAAEGATDEATVRGWLREELLALVDPSMDRSLVSSRVDGRPACILVVGVNGTGKTTTVGKLARVLVAEDKDVVLGAADTFRAAAADQLATWGSGWACRRCAPTARAPTRPPSPSTPSRPPPRWRPTSSSSTPPGGCRTRPA